MIAYTHTHTHTHFYVAVLIRSSTKIEVCIGEENFLKILPMKTIIILSRIWYCEIISVILRGMQIGMEILVAVH